LHLVCIIKQNLDSHVNRCLALSAPLYSVKTLFCQAATALYYFPIVIISGAKSSTVVESTSAGHIHPLSMPSVLHNLC
jgi:hypothetical protein